ncbi:Maf family nucleotide pyrophosphatase [Halorhodospira halochloris]|uniref:dTTP/UTP pyrophosphatase n=1 Tax=Halorhodospira halochloris TaxID=1052 RepID=A0A110B5U5_HALHR|nr:Maf family protein [Halorhodospira halochloris]MBK1651695.1 septum formation protein Maf [Halorhodospira halochloris]MCG5529617.1 Maf family nucleotide pyrophosphatase [Halorhodospira halochloris]MCG5548104.1 Maf family nucleotide pyrophosphatase [Halorhodospira halochloris]BAU58558.1 septum formation protein Maf [Halorhodospira halochloris]
MDQLITLASRSPRRKELLELIGIKYHSIMVVVDETPDPNEGAEMYVLRMALEKARRGYAVAEGGAPALGADTAVVLDDQILGKPKDKTHARDMLLSLSGHTHRVVTGVALADDREATRLSVSHVTLRTITEEEVERYWASGEPADKAGAYAIQGLGGVFVEHLEGSYTGVMGLPLYETTLLFDEFALPWREGWSG